MGATELQSKKNKASTRYFETYEAEFREFIAAAESKAGLKQPTLLDKKDKLAVLAVSCYTDLSLLCSG